MPWGRAWGDAGSEGEGEEEEEGCEREGEREADGEWEGPAEPEPEPEPSSHVLSLLLCSATAAYQGYTSGMGEDRDGGDVKGQGKDVSVPGRHPVMRQRRQFTTGRPLIRHPPRKNWSSTGPAYPPRQHQQLAVRELFLLLLHRSWCCLVFLGTRRLIPGRPGPRRGQRVTAEPLTEKGASSASSQRCPEDPRDPSAEHGLLPLPMAPAPHHIIPRGRRTPLYRGVRRCNRFTGHRCAGCRRCKLLG